MNTIETERLVRRICSTLNGEGDQSMAPKLAEDFNTIYSSVSLRLEQCRNMIEAGAAAQAVQLAETSPNLLDMVTLLEFRQLDEWRQFCQKHGFPCRERVSARAVTALNDCYTRGITSQHPLYAAYREAVFAKNDEAALLSLKSIVRLNPADNNAASELVRLDAKILAERLNRLERYLKSDETSALRELESIETFGFKTKISGKAWQRGQILRCGKLLQEAENLMLSGALANAVVQLDLLAQLQTDHSLQWPEEWPDRLERVRDWCHAESAARQKEEQFSELLEQFTNVILVCEQKEAQGKSRNIAELKSELAGLHKMHARLESFSRPVSENLVARFQQQSAKMQRKINRQSRTRVLLVAAGAGAAVLVLLTMSFVYLGLQRANTLTAEINKAVKNHQIRTLEVLLKQAGQASWFRTEPLKLAVTAANTEITRQLNPLAKYESAFKELPQQFGDIKAFPQFATVVSNYNLARLANQELSKDLQNETQPKLEEFRSRWAGYCAQMLPAIKQQVDDQITRLEVNSTQSDAAEIKQIRGNLLSAVPELQQLSQTITNLGVFVSLPPVLANRCASLLAKLQNTQSDLSKLDADVAALSQAKTIADYARLVAEIGSIPVHQSDYERAAQKAKPVNDLKDSPENLARALFAGTNSILWQSLKQKQSINLTPAKVKSETRQRFIELMRDYAVNGNHHLYKLFFDEQSSRSQEWITSEALVTEPGWHVVQGWKLDSLGGVEFHSLDYGYFGGKCMLTNQVAVFNLTDTSLAGITSTWGNSGFSKLINLRGMSYNQPPLKIADALCADTGGSPVFRAYLLRELVTIMAQQPEESGINFTPVLRTLPEQMRLLGVDQIHSGDWFVNSRVAALQPAIEKLFEKLKSVSYYQQGSRLVEAISQAAKSDFVFAGHVKPDGSPAWNETPANGTVWGYQDGKSEPALLYTVRDGAVNAINRALPLTPLLRFSGDLPALIANAGVRPDDPVYQGVLPPIFTSMGALPKSGSN